MMIKNQMRTIPVILIPQLDADAEEHIINRTIPQIPKKIGQDEDDAIVKMIMTHLILPVAAADAVKNPIAIPPLNHLVPAVDAVKNPIAIPLLGHLVPDAAAAKNHVLQGHQKTTVLEDLHHHNLPGEKDLNPILQEIIKIRSQEFRSQE